MAVADMITVASAFSTLASEEEGSEIDDLGAPLVSIWRFSLPPEGSIEIDISPGALEGVEVPTGSIEIISLSLGSCGGDGSGVTATGSGVSVSSVESLESSSCFWFLRGGGDLIPKDFSDLRLRSLVTLGISELVSPSVVNCSSSAFSFFLLSTDMPELISSFSIRHRMTQTQVVWKKN